ncbi:ankyrin repeat domain-containing protein [Spirillospora sp. CA-253888]
MSSLSVPAGAKPFDSFAEAEQTAWALARRYAVPRRMIEQAAERRAAGDWRGACAAADVDVEIDPAHLTPDLEDDLRHLAPDLLRWHLPRFASESCLIVPHRALLLGEYGGRTLHVLTPPSREAPQRLRLRLGTPPGDGPPGSHAVVAAEDWAGHRCLWDARHTAGLRTRYGGDRVPGFRADGAPLTGRELPDGAPGRDDPVVFAEWVRSLQERGEFEAALGAVGLAEVCAEPGTSDRDWAQLLGAMRADLTLLAREIARLREAGVPGAVLWTHAKPRLTLTLDDLRLHREAPPGAEGAPCVPLAAWQRHPDLALLHDGRLAPEDLHPLVRDALFPERPPAERPVGPPDPTAPEPLRVRCQGEKHLVVLRKGRLEVPHTPEEQRREEALRALGGAVSGCTAVVLAWKDGWGWLPRELREQVRDLFLRAQHGDTAGVLWLLDAGVDAHVRGTRRRTLLHHAHLLDHRALLPRLLEAGLDIDVPDADGRTALQVMVREHGSADAVRALVEAGANTRVTEADGRPLSEWARRLGRTDLDFLP